MSGRDLNTALDFTKRQKYIWYSARRESWKTVLFVSPFDYRLYFPEKDRQFEVIDDELHEAIQWDTQVCWLFPHAFSKWLKVESWSMEVRKWTAPSHRRSFRFGSLWHVILPSILVTTQNCEYYPYRKPVSVKLNQRLDQTFKMPPYVLKVPIEVRISLT